MADGSGMPVVGVGKLDPKADPTRRCLKLEHWPATDRRAWEVAVAPGGLLAEAVGEPGVFHTGSFTCARASRRRAMPRRTRVFTVPRGSPRAAAIWLWLSPSK